MTKKKENKPIRNKNLPKYNNQNVDTRKDEKHVKSVQKLLDALKGGLNKESACSFANISKWMFYARVKDPEFWTLVKDAVDYRIGVVENQKRKLIMKEHRPAIEKELKSRKREIYGDKLGIDDGEGWPAFGSIKIKIVK